MSRLITNDLAVYLLQRCEFVKDAYLSPGVVRKNDLQEAVRELTEVVIALVKELKEN